MTIISVELVPRDPDYLKNDLELIQKNFTSITAINIPDIIRLNVRSWHGASVSRDYFPYSIPHIRAIDFQLGNFPLIDYIESKKIPAVLIVRGDTPQELNRPIYDTQSIDLISLFKRKLPHIKVYAALDQYRQNFKKERDYARKKIDAGAEGLFTQPFFDLKFMDLYFDQFQNDEIFFGVSPVYTEKSQNYWEIKNNVIFPRNFNRSIEWNKQFARKALDYCYDRNSNIYFMPIKIDLKNYLNGIFNES